MAAGCNSGSRHPRKAWVRPEQAWVGISGFRVCGFWGLGLRGLMFRASEVLD